MDVRWRKQNGGEVKVMDKTSTSRAASGAVRNESSSLCAPGPKTFLFRAENFFYLGEEKVGTKKCGSGFFQISFKSYKY